MQIDELDRTIEALLFLSAEPQTEAALAEACRAEPSDVKAAIGRLSETYAEGRRGICLRHLAGGYTFASDPAFEAPARSLFAKPGAHNLSQAQLECLTIAAYVGPVSRPDIARIRGVSSESAVANLVDRGLLTESGRSQFGAVRYKTTELFEKLFGLASRDDLPSLDEYGASDEERAKLRERLLKVGDARVS